MNMSDEIGSCEISAYAHKENGMCVRFRPGVFAGDYPDRPPIFRTDPEEIRREEPEFGGGQRTYPFD
jgi:hypothetical protein